MFESKNKKEFKEYHNQKWHQEEEKRDTNQHGQNKQMHEKQTKQLSLPQAR